MDFKEQNQMIEALTSAIQIISKSNVNDKKATIIIEAEIIEVIDLNEGKYKVKYLDNKFEVYSICYEIQYKINDLVYIIIPNSDFNKRKIILSLIGSIDLNNIIIDAEKTKILDNDKEYYFKDYIDEKINSLYENFLLSLNKNN